MTWSALPSEHVHAIKAGLCYAHTKILLNIHPVNFVNFLN